jgi:hypothetical protein
MKSVLVRDVIFCKFSCPVVQKLNLSLSIHKHFSMEGVGGIIVVVAIVIVIVAVVKEK